MMIRLLLLLLLTAFLAGCNEPRPYIARIGNPTMHTATSHASTEPALPPSEKRRFILSIAQTKPAGPVDTMIGHDRLRGVYSGQVGHCVGVTLIDQTLGRADNYKVCGSRVSMINDVAPSYPSQEDAQIARRSAVNSAFLNGKSTQIWQGYVIHAKSVGPIRTDGCARIYSVITFRGMLVHQGIETVCESNL